MSILAAAGWTAAVVSLWTCSVGAAELAGAESFRKNVEPILIKHCYDCHGGGEATAKVAFDGFKSDRDLLENRDLWWKALKQLQAGMMPPRDEAQPSAQQKKQILDWIKAAVFESDPANPDPGRVTVRRLNRVEYRNTIRDLMGVDFNTETEFPADDSGHGFDNLGDVLTLSPLLLEKYLDAARTIVTRAVPAVSRMAPETTIDGKSFRRAGAAPGGDSEKGELSLSYYEPASVSTTFATKHAGKYQLVLQVSAHEKFVDGVFDYNKCRLTFAADGQELLRKEFSWQGGKTFHFESDRQWQAGEHTLAIELEPLTPNEKQVRSLELRIVAATVRGPISAEHWVRPPGYERFFPGEVPENPAQRRQYAQSVLARFTTRAFRRPADAQTVERLTDLAQSVYSQQGQALEAGVAHAMTAVLASPRFLFREEGIEAGPPGQHPLLDEYALASRLSYFLWSTMPDEELFRLAEEHKLRQNLDGQVKRMLADPRSGEFIRHFTGQWLQARDIDTVIINAAAVVSRDQQQDPDVERRRARFRELRSKPPESLTAEEKAELERVRTAFFGSFRRFRQFELTGELRRAMRRETEMLFEHIVREDRSLVELIDCDYTFLNEVLARHYGIEDVRGSEMRLVALPPDSVRGGVLTQATMLAITSNPDRTSPVKRGLFILDNILGSPPPPPPPDIPPLEDAAKELPGTPTLRQTLEVHRKQALCSSCHNRMDPLGLALENFNALGTYRENERGQPIDSTGRLITGESFGNIRELKRILVNERRQDFYRCLTAKLLTYAIGRGLDYHDVQTVDTIVERLNSADGRPSALLMGVIESAPFQRRRSPDATETSIPISQDTEPRAKP